MEIEENEDAYITYTDYCQDYLLEGLDNCDERENLIDPAYQHFDLEQLNHNFLSLKEVNDLFALHLNAVSLVANFDEIHSLIMTKTKHSPDIVCISETRLKDEKIEAQTQLVNIPEYNLVYDNSSSSAGGVAIYMKNSLNYELKKEFRLKVDDCESIFVELDFKDKTSSLLTKSSLLIGCIYRHPRYKIDTFLAELSKKLDMINCRNIPVLLMGDININTKNPLDNVAKEYIDTLSSLGCTNLIEGYTHTLWLNEL